MRIGILVLFLVGSTGCGSVGQQLKAQAKADPPTAQGTGFLVRPDGLILTAWHVVKDARRIGVQCEGRERVFATLAERSPALDLALLQTPRFSADKRDSARRTDRSGEDQSLSLGPLGTGITPSVYRISSAAARLNSRAV